MAQADVGQRYVTDATGKAHVTATVVLDQRRRHLRQANFVDSLTRVPQPTDHLLVGLELPLPAGPLLYVVEVARFPDGDVVLDAFDVYLPDSAGAFVRRAGQDGKAWRIALADGFVLSHPGYEPWRFRLPPIDARSVGWQLDLALTQLPRPVWR